MTTISDSDGLSEDSGSAPSGHSFVPVTLSVKGLSYTVSLPQKGKKELLRGIDAFFKPSTMTALMGSSGAGKRI